MARDERALLAKRLATEEADPGHSGLGGPKRAPLFAELGQQVPLEGGTGQQQASPTEQQQQQEQAEEEEEEGTSPVTEIESLCMQCGQNGITRLLLTRIPFFKEIILMAFSCPHCHFSNNEVQSASAMAEQGISHTVHIATPKDLSRQVVKSEYGSVRLVEADFEIPASTQRGIMTTVEGLLLNAKTALEQEQPYRLQHAPQVHAAVQRILEQLTAYLAGTETFTFVLRDPSGNSFIEPLMYPVDPTIATIHFTRTAEELEAMGYGPDQAATAAADATPAPASDGQDGPTSMEAQPDEPAEPEFDLQTQVHVFPGNCSRCNAPGDTKMHMLDIPHFKQVIIMSTVCDVCGYKSNEVKSGGAISPIGHLIRLRVTCADDLSRDVLKSETCKLVIPEIDLELGQGTLGGRFSTLEGIFTSVIEELEGKAAFVGGDSAEGGSKRSFEEFITRLKATMALERGPFTVLLDDPLGNSYLQNLYAPDPDPEMEVVEYERTYEQNEDFGLNDLKTEDYAAEQ